VSTLIFYILFFQHHGHAKDVVTLLGRIVNILQAYISRDGPRALQYLQTHALLLRYGSSQPGPLSRHYHVGFCLFTVKSSDKIQVSERGVTPEVLRNFLKSC